MLFGPLKRKLLLFFFVFLSWPSNKTLSQQSLLPSSLFPLPPPPPTTVCRQQTNTFFVYFNLSRKRSLLLSTTCSTAAGKNAPSFFLIFSSDFLLWSTKRLQKLLPWSILRIFRVSGHWEDNFSFLFFLNDLLYNLIWVEPENSRQFEFSILFAKRAANRFQSAKQNWPSFVFCPFLLPSAAATAGLKLEPPKQNFLLLSTVDRRYLVTY